MPKISVIVPNYNHEKYLSERLNSILNQTFQDFEIILLDDCSTDNSVGILQEYLTNKKVTQLVVNSQNSGSPFVQWNRGVALSKGEYIWIAESDDYASPLFLEGLVSLLDSDFTIGVAYCQSVVVHNYEEGESLLWWTHSLDKERWKNSFINEGLKEIELYACIQNTIMNASSALFRKQVYKEIVPKNIESYRLCGDWLSWIHIFSKSKVAFIPQSFNFYRFHESSVRENMSKSIATYVESLKVQAISFELNYKVLFNLKYHTSILKRFSSLLSVCQNNLKGYFLGLKVIYSQSTLLFIVSFIPVTFFCFIVLLKRALKSTLLRYASK